jgi:hypothetical protein
MGLRWGSSYIKIIYYRKKKKSEIQVYDLEMKAIQFAIV